jgi:hypothetical protein
MMADNVPKPPTDLPRDVGSSCPVLARIPELVAEARPAPERPARPTPAVRPSGRRFDPPRPRATSMELARTFAAPSDSGQRGAHAPRTPAHHLNHRAARVRINEDDPLAIESPVLPAWNPFSITTRRLPEAFAPLLSFLVMVALFTVAGTSVLLLRKGPGESRGDSPHAAAEAELGSTASASRTAKGPLGASTSRLLPATNDDARASIAAPPTSPPPIAPSTRHAADNDPTGLDSRPSAARPATELGMPPGEYAEPVFPNPADIKLPPAQATKPLLPVARFSGEILEAETRQAKNEDQSILH